MFSFVTYPMNFYGSREGVLFFFFRGVHVKTFFVISLCVLKKSVNILGYRPIKMLEQDLVKSPLCLAHFNPHKKIKVDD